MAQSYLPTSQIILFTVFGINILFWIILLSWKFCCQDTMTNSLNRCRRVINSLANLTINVNQMHNFTIRGAVMKINSDLPPPYEQAIKYPSLSSISGQLTANCNSIYHGPSESNSNCLRSSLEPAPSYYESQISSLPLPQPQASSSSSSSTSFVSSLSPSSFNSSKKPINEGSLFFSSPSSSLQRSFSFNDVESFKKLQQYLYNV